MGKQHQQESTLEWVGYWFGVYLRAIDRLRRERDEARAEVAALRQRVRRLEDAPHHG